MMMKNMAMNMEVITTHRVTTLEGKKRKKSRKCVMI